MLDFIKKTLSHFVQSNTSEKGAALAFYAVFSLLPIIVIATSLLGVFFGEQAVSGEIYLKLKDVLGSGPAQQVQEIIKDQHFRHNTLLTSLIGFVTLLLSAAGMFNQIHNSFNNIWNIKAKPKYGIIHYLTVRLASFSILILFFFIMLISSAMTSFLIRYINVLQQGFELSFVYEHLASLFVGVLVFSLMFHFLSDAKVHWRASLVGGLFTAILFVFGKLGIGIYLEHSQVSSAFGSASVLALIMLWVYYTSQIIYLGASFVKIFSDKFGLSIVAGKNAVRIEYKELDK